MRPEKITQKVFYFVKLIVDLSYTEVFEVLGFKDYFDFEEES